MTFTRDNPTDPTIPYVGSNISYSCQTLLPSHIPDDVTGSVEISDPSGTPIDSTGGRVMVSESTRNGNTFTRTLHFSPLSAGDMGEYTCTGTIQPATPNPLVTNGMGSATGNIIIIGKRDWKHCRVVIIAQLLRLPH